ncbi:hypothetical protein [Micromonospora sp. NPDC023888]|uniref:hypothetical protein n=1 Tax=Micromonospora sp. NPDC023888 TaxID=3155607 RepID=UPI0033FFFE8C
MPLFSPKVRLGFGHPAMDGDRLAHTDLGPANLIVTEDQVPDMGIRKFSISRA